MLGGLSIFPISARDLPPNLVRLKRHWGNGVLPKESSKNGAQKEAVAFNGEIVSCLTSSYKEFVKNMKVFETFHWYLPSNESC